MRNRGSQIPPSMLRRALGPRATTHFSTVIQTRYAARPNQRASLHPAPKQRHPLLHLQFGAQPDRLSGSALASTGRQHDVCAPIALVETYGRYLSAQPAPQPNEKPAPRKEASKKASSSSSVYAAKAYIPCLASNQ